MAKRLVALFFALLASFAHAESWDAASEFSATQNPSGPWVYGWQRGGLFTPFPSPHLAGTCFVGGMDCWTENDGSWVYPHVGLPEVAEDWSNSLQGDGWIVAQRGWLLMHPGVGYTDGHQAAIAFVVPASDFYRVTATFQAVDTRPTGVEASLMLDGVAINSKPISAFGEVANFRLARDLTAGQVLVFSLGAYGSPLGDSTAVRISIVREPR
jgi:hypothetical protein